MVPTSKTPAMAAQNDVACLPPGSTIGILGGGQLARMLAIAAARLGMRSHIYADEGNLPAEDVAAKLTVGSYTDWNKLAAFARDVDVITYEFENVPVGAVQTLVQSTPVRPGANALEVAQDRRTEKEFIDGLGIPVAPFCSIDPDDFNPTDQSIDGLLPGFLKTRRNGYDGKGQIAVASRDDIATAIAEFTGTPLILEKRIPFAFEVSVLIARGSDGDTAIYDIPRNEHSAGILRRSLVRNHLLDANTQSAANELACKIADELGYIGLLAVELFVCDDNSTTSLLVNEIAPRVHNSGHWTQDACVCDQFENHIRAVCGWPLGPCTRLCDIEMINLIGNDVNQWAHYAGDPNAQIHLYGKREVRAGRKMGHVNRRIQVRVQ